jgi:polyisoprenoid-binding protein YceI
MPFACLAVLTPSVLTMTASASRETATSATASTYQNIESTRRVTAGETGAIIGHSLVFSSGLSEARYRVREAMLGTSDVHEVLGAASGVSGSVAVDPNGTVLADRSRIAIDLRTLQTDQSARDEIVRNTTLDTPRYPVSEFYPTGFDDLGAWPTDGDAHFGMNGDLVLHGVRQPMRLEVVGHFTPDGVTGTASGTVSLAAFGIDAPQLGPLVAVQDAVAIELDFRAQNDSTALVVDSSEALNASRSFDQTNSQA